MNTRKIEDYYAVWTDGHAWPELFYNREAAKARAEHLARDKIGHTVHICQFESVGTVMYPANRNVSGLMADHDGKLVEVEPGTIGRAVN